MKKLFILLFIICLIPIATATTYYIDCNSGSDVANGLTNNTPFKTITKANSIKTVDDTIQLKGGVVCRTPRDGYPDVESSNWTSYGTGRANLYGSNYTNDTSDYVLVTGSLYKNNISRITFPMEPGNIYFINSSGDWNILHRNWSIGQINSGGQGYWYWNVSGDKTVWINSPAGNPVTVYGHMEIALYNTIVGVFNNEANWNWQEIDLKFGGTHGFDTDGINVTIKNTDCSYMGGGNLTGAAGIGRMGNCYQIWRCGELTTITNTTASNAWDALYTYQSSNSAGESCINDNITFTYNVGHSAPYMFELFQQDVDSRVTSLNFSHNTGFNCGTNIYTAQREETVETLWGRCLRVGTTINVSNFYFYDNIMFDATEYAFNIPGSYSNISTYRSNYNLWYRNISNGLTGFLGRFPVNGVQQSYTTLAHYQTNTSQDLNSWSFSANPFVDSTNNDFRLKADSGLCTNSSTGTFVGALSCVSSISSSNFVTFKGENINIFGIGFVLYG